MCRKIYFHFFFMGLKVIRINSTDCRKERLKEVKTQKKKHLLLLLLNYVRVRAVFGISKYFCFDRAFQSAATKCRMYARGMMKMFQITKKNYISTFKTVLYLFFYICLLNV